MNILLAVGSVLMYLLPCFIIFISVFYDKLRIPLWGIIMICTGLTGTSIASALYSFQTKGFYQQWKEVIAVFFITLFCLCLFTVFKYSLAQQLFFVFVMRNYLDTVDLFVASFQQIHCGKLPSYGEYGMVLATKAILIFLTAPLMWLFIKKLLRPILDRTEHLEFWRLIWLIPFFYFLVYQLSISYIGRGFLSGLQIFALPPVWAFCTFLSYYLVLHMLSESNQKSRLEEQLHISEVRVAAQEKQFDSLQDKIEYTRQIKHDMRHSLLAIQKYAAEKDFISINTYLQDYLNNFASDPQLIFCANKSLDAVISYYITQAREAGIETSVKSTVPATIIQAESDACIIIGNLLENALEACLRSPSDSSYIHLTLTYSSVSALSISIVNTYQDAIRRKADLFYSSKREGPGIGIESIRNIAEKYCGLTRFDYDRYVFRSTVYLTSMKH